MPSSNVSQPAHNSVDWKISQVCHGWFATYHVAPTQMYKVGNMGGRTFTKAIEGLKWSQLRQTPVAGTIGGGLAGPVSVHKKYKIWGWLIGTVAKFRAQI